MASKEDVSVVPIPEGRPQRRMSKRLSLGNRKFTGQLIMACAVTWCCGCVIGLIALLFAVLANKRAANGDDQEARKFGRWSYAVSVLGIVVGSIAIVAIIVCISVKPRFGLPAEVYNRG